MSGPTSAGERITTLDAVRGIAVLGILPMNALVFGLDDAAYANVSADGIHGPLDWVVGILSMIFVDQKMMGLFSLLFGVGVVLFAERAKASGRRAGRLSLWRFTLLLAIGLVHSILWVGDILSIYAVLAPFVLLVRRLPAAVLALTGAALTLAGLAFAPGVQAATGGDLSGLGAYWYPGADADEFAGTAGIWGLLNGLGRALGLMLIGVALYRLGVVQGTRSPDFYRRLARWGIGVGAAVTAVGVAWHAATNWSGDYAITGAIPTGLGLLPMVCGYMAAIILWNARAGRGSERVRNAGRMALTNYLSQSVLGVVMLEWALSDAELSRTAIAVWVVGVWALQLWWSTWWLARFRHGPVEWLWRSATYRTWTPLRRSRGAA